MYFLMDCIDRPFNCEILVRYKNMNLDLHLQYWLYIAALKSFMEYVLWIHSKSNCLSTKQLFGCIRMFNWHSVWTVMARQMLMEFVRVLADAAGHNVIKYAVSELLGNTNV